MKVRVQLFARARDVVGAEWALVELADSATIADLRLELSRNYPPLESLVSRSAIALNEEFAQDSDAIDAQAKLALLPPVSGGAFGSC
jgi:molybdopterin converting factor small subunit